MGDEVEEHLVQWFAGTGAALFAILVGAPVLRWLAFVASGIASTIFLVLAFGSVSLAVLYLFGQPAAFLDARPRWRWGSALVGYLLVAGFASLLDPPGGFPPGPGPLGWLLWPGWLFWLFLGPWFVPAT